MLTGLESKTMLAKDLAHAGSFAPTLMLTIADNC